MERWMYNEGSGSFTCKYMSSLSPRSYNFEDAKRAPHKFSPSEDANCDGHLTSDRHGRPGVRS